MELARVRILEPCQNFLKNLEIINPKLAYKANWLIELLKMNEISLTAKYTKTIIGTNGLLKELRVRQGSNICRLFYFEDEGKIYVISSGYIKKEDKTDPQEIKRALRFIKEYLDEKKENY